MTIALTREEAQQVLDALEDAADHIGCPDDDDAIGIARRTLRARLAQPEQEWKYNPMTGEPLVDGWPLYSGLPKRELQGLTNEEILAIIDGFDPYVDSYLYLFRAIEAKLKEKNT